MRFFEWAADKGLSMADLGQKLGYSERHLWRLKAGDYPITEGFKARVVYAFGDDARSLFLDSVSDNSGQSIRPITELCVN